MKKLLLISALSCIFMQVALAQNPINSMGGQLDFGYHRNHYEDYTGDTMDDEGTTNTISISPKFRLALTPNINVGIGLGYVSEKYTQENPGNNSNKTTDNETMLGPSLSFTRYCDPCESEEDCIRYFTFMGLNMDMLSGKREYQYTMGNFNYTEMGKVRQTNVALSGGVAYRILPGVYAQGSVNILSMNRTKTIYDNKNPKDYRINNDYGVLRGGSAGLILPF
jgi:opacity protein-like surface antigen